MAGPTTYVVLLRGVNVGGRRIGMTALRECLTGLGLQDVRTYLQSGNAVLVTDEVSVPRLRSRIEAALEERFGFDVPVVVLTAADLAAVVTANPYPGLADQPTRLVVSFRPDRLPAEVASSFTLDDFPESGVLGESVLYLHYPDGQGRSKLTPDVLQRRLGGAWGTARNWRTVLALLEMAQGPPHGQ